MLWFLSIVLLAPNIPTRPLPIAALLDAPTRHVRTTDRIVAGLLKMGAERSYSFARLLRDLEQTDVCVYVERVADLPSRIEGRMLVLPIAGPRRYVRIEVDIRPGHDPALGVALIAHELWHALEVAHEPTVHDSATLAALYQRIGQRSIGENFYDTLAAREMGNQVRRELAA